jgi:hypothetical protein
MATSDTVPPVNTKLFRFDMLPSPTSKRKRFVPDVTSDAAAALRVVRPPAGYCALSVERRAQRGEHDRVYVPAEVCPVGVPVLHERAGNQGTHRQVRQERTRRDLRIDFAASHRAIQDALQCHDLGLDQRLVEHPCQVGVLIHGVEKSAHQTGVLLAATGHLAHDLAQIAGQRAGVDLRHGGRLACLQGGNHQFRLALPLPVQRGLAGMGARRDGVHRQRVVADLAQQLDDGRVEFSLPFRAEPGTAGAPSSLDRHGVLPPVRNGFVQPIK